MRICKQIVHVAIVRTSYKSQYVFTRKKCILSSAANQVQLWLTVYILNSHFNSSL